jgi:hypothetical protein
MGTTEVLAAVTDDGKIVAFSQTEAVLAQLTSEYKDVQFDVATTAGMASATAARRELRDLRVSLEKRRKEIKDPVIKLGQIIDAEAKRITLVLESLEDPIDDQIRAEEKAREDRRQEKARAEAERVAAIQKKIARINAEPALLAGKSAAELAARLDVLRSLAFTKEAYEEFVDDAGHALMNVIVAVEGMLERQQVHEAEQARIVAEREELAKLRAENEALVKANAEAQRLAEEAAQAEREEADRLAKAEREEADRAAKIERDRLEEERRSKEAAEREARMRQQAAEDTERERLRLQAEEDARVAAAERARLEEEHLKVITLYDAATSALDFLLNRGYETELVTRGLRAALDRS